MKKGISLIVLVITIIVMIILAASVVISLNNSSVIDRAGDAVQVTNVKQVEQLAALAWADAYADGERDVIKLQEAVDAAMTKSKVDTNIFQAIASINGVVVVDKTAKAEITFTIAGTTYKAIEGSTWAEWVESEYNTSGRISFATDPNYITNGTYGLAYFDNKEYVLAEHEIIDGEEYFWQE